MGGPEPLAGGVANVGSVVRDGDHVLRPAGPHTPAVHALFRYVRDRGFDGVPEPIGIEPDGRERLVFIPGEVAVAPFPAWFQTDAALASVAGLLRRYHEAVAGFSFEGARWSRELADPAGGDLLCHNDVCPENVVFRDGEAVVLLDFDFAAPGRPLHDLAALASMCVPLDRLEAAARWGWESLDAPARLRVAVDAYGISTRAERLAVLDHIGVFGERGREFVRRRVEAGEPGFVAMVEQMGGLQRYDRRREWLESNRERFVAALE